MSRTVLLAVNQREARIHCDELGIPPRGRDTVIPSDYRTLQGLRLAKDDKILCCRLFWRHRHCMEIIAELQRSAARSPGREPGTRLRIEDIWEDIGC